MLALGVKQLEKYNNNNNKMTSIMLLPTGPTVLTMSTLGVEVERCLWRDWPSPPGRGKRKAEVGDSRLSLDRKNKLRRNLIILFSV